MTMLHDIERGLYAGSIFEKLKLSLKQIVLLIYEQAYITPVEQAFQKTGVHRNSAIKGKKIFSQNVLVHLPGQIYHLVEQARLCKLTIKNLKL